MVVIKPKKGESADSLINRFRKVTAVIVKEARDRRWHTTKAEERKEERQRRDHRDSLKRQRNEQAQ